MLYQEVDTPPRLRASRVLYYPKDHVDVQGTATVLVVIDTMGLPEGGSISVKKATDPAFAAAARLTVEAEQFTPGLSRGKKVRVLMEQQVRFRKGTVACASVLVFDGVSLCTDSTESASR